MNQRYGDFGLLFLRVFFGLGLAYHGYTKLVQPGFMPMFATGVSALGFPAPMFFAWAATLSEFAGGMALALGLGGCIPSIFIAFTMGIAAFGAHANDPFQKKELALAFLVVAMTLAMTGSGRFSLDRLIARPKA